MEGGGSKIASHILHGIYTHWPTQSTTRVEYTFCAYFFMSESLHMFLSCLKNGLLCLQIYLGLWFESDYLYDLFKLLYVEAFPAICSHLMLKQCGLAKTNKEIFD